MFHFKGSPYSETLLLGLKGPPGTNTVDYYELLQITAVKSLIALGTLRTYQGRLLTLPINNRLGWKGLQGTNTLAYYEN